MLTVTLLNDHLYNRNLKLLMWFASWHEFSLSAILNPLRVEITLFIPISGKSSFEIKHYIYSSDLCG